MLTFIVRRKRRLSLIHIYVQSRQMVTFNNRMELLETELKEYVKKKYRVTIVCSSKERTENLKEFTGRIGLAEKVFFAEGSLTSGMDFPEEKICYISENDIFSGQKAVKRKKKKKKTKSEQIQTFADMQKRCV